MSRLFLNPHPATSYQRLFVSVYISFSLKAILHCDYYKCCQLKSLGASRSSYPTNLYLTLVL
jgi:hypothetical protein